MNKLLIVTTAVCLMAGCSSHRTLTPVTNITQIHTDTLHDYHWHFDSVYVYHDRLQKQVADTVYIRDSLIQYRYSMIHDTLIAVRADSIPYVHQVEVVRTERYIPTVYRYSMTISITLMTLLIFYLIWKLKTRKPIFFNLLRTRLQQ